MGWIVVQTKSNCEKKATLNLTRQGYKVFFPKIEKTVVKFHKICQLFKPLFPGYIFVSLKENQSWNKINYTYGVFKILQFNEKLYFLPKNIVDKIKVSCNENEVFIAKKQFRRGQKVKLIKQNYLTLDAVFEEHIDQKRSYVFLEFLKQKIKTKIDTIYLESFV
tara:strand:- start:45 stop:536 length:492 start_codon:yes stop_codon:yes gene_type:complete